jgi:ATP phosphoribosyltransferase
MWRNLVHKDSPKFEKLESRCATLAIPRKITLGHYCVAIARKLGIIPWYETRKFYERMLSVKTRLADFIEAKELDIPKIVDNGLAALGITYASDFYEYTRIKVAEGVRAKNLEVLFEFPFCFQIISAVGSRKCKYARAHEGFPVLVSPSIFMLSDLVLGDLSKKVTKIKSCSIPQELAYLNSAIFGIDKIIPKREFEGDVGEDGRPLDHFVSLDVFPLRSIVLEGKNFALDQVINKPILIGNVKYLKNEDIKRIANEIIWLINTRDQKEWKIIRVQTKSGEIRIKSHDARTIADIINTGYKLFIERGRFRAWNPKNLIALIDLGGHLTSIIKSMLEDYDFFLRIVSKEGKIRRSNLARILKKLDKEGVEFVLFYGPKEAENKYITLKNMRTREQKTINFDNFTEILKEELFYVQNEETKSIVLVQEPGYPGYERRLFKPGREYVQKTYNLLISDDPLPKIQENEKIKVVKVNYRDMLRLIINGYAHEGVLGYERLLDLIAQEGKVDDLVDVDGFNTTAEKSGLPLKIKNLGNAQCKLVLAVPMSTENLSNDDILTEEIWTEYPGIAKLLSKHFLNIFRINEVNGCAEVYPGMILDVMSSGETLRKNEKKVFLDVLTSFAVLVEKK